MLNQTLPQTPDLDDETMFKIADDLISRHVFFVTLTGGEPLTRRELVVGLSQHLTNHGIIVSLNTCLAPLTEHVLSGLAVNHYLISCPSAVPDHYHSITGGGDYQRFERHLKSVVATGSNLTVNMVVIHGDP